MLGTDGQAVHRFRCADDICAVIADPRGVSRRAGPVLPLRVFLASGGRERHPVRTVVAARTQLSQSRKLSGLAQQLASC